jgi:hypothetical protein
MFKSNHFSKVKVEHFHLLAMRGCQNMEVESI